MTLVLAATVALGLAVHTIFEAVAPSWAGGAVVEGGRFADVIGNWVLIPQEHANFGNFAYVTLIVAILVLTQIRPSRRIFALPFVAYLATVVWETSFVLQPAVARWILFGALLS